MGKKWLRLVILTLKNINFTEIQFFLNDVDIYNIIISKKISFTKKKKNYKYFIGYRDDDYKIKPFHLMLPKTSTYVKSYVDETKLMYFPIEDDELLKKCNNIWNKVSNNMKL